MTTFVDEHKPLSLLSDEELREELRQIRKARRAQPKRTAKKKSPKPKKPKALKVSNDISAEDAANLLKQLGVS